MDANTKATLATQLKMNETQDMKTTQEKIEERAARKPGRHYPDLNTNRAMFGIEVKTTRKEALTQQGILEETTEANKSYFQARLEEDEGRTGGRSTRTVGVGAVQPQYFNENRSSSVFRRQFEIIAEHNQWSDREKSTYLITAMKDWAGDTSGTRGPFSRPALCRHLPQLTRTQKAGESLHDFATAIEQLAQRATPTLF
jgi:hypothetical protein